MSRTLVAVTLLVVGLALMANPLYLPVELGEGDREYTHTVQSTDGPLGSDGDEPFPESAIVHRDELDTDARAAFDRALAERDATSAGFSVTDPDERVSSLSYPEHPEPGNGILLVEHDGGEHEFVTRTVVHDPPAVALQRIVVQPVAFLLGFLAFVGAVAVGFREEISGVVETNDG